MVAEVASRFEDIRAFVNAMAQLGFKSISKVCPQVCPVLGTGSTGSNQGALRRSPRSLAARDRASCSGSGAGQHGSAWCRWGAGLGVVPAYEGLWG